MLTINDFDKAKETSTRSNRRALRMTPKKPIAGLDNLEISLFTTGFKRGDSVIWGWLWWANNNQSYDSSEGKDGGPPSQEYFTGIPQIKPPFLDIDDCLLDTGSQSI